MVAPSMILKSNAKTTKQKVDGGKKAEIKEMEYECGGIYGGDIGYCTSFAPRRYQMYASSKSSPPRF